MQSKDSKRGHSRSARRDLLDEDQGQGPKRPLPIATSAAARQPFLAASLSFSCAPAERSLLSPCGTPAGRELSTVCLIAQAIPRLPGPIRGLTEQPLQSPADPSSALNCLDQRKIEKRVHAATFFDPSPLSILRRAADAPFPFYIQHW
jgi:hypothetical protein